ncbi:MAG: ABC transporter permease, partial [Sphingomonas sp.]|nr:ABC transporter permease [Sphingomonas sp.]
MREIIRGAFVIARRDVSATVLSKSFLLFLLGPLFPVLVGMIFGSIAVSASSRTVDHRVVAVVASEQEFAGLSAARDRIGAAFETVRLVAIRRVEPERDPHALRQRLLANHDVPVIGVLDGSLDRARFSSGQPPGDHVLRQLQLIIDHARIQPGAAPPPMEIALSSAAPGPSTAERPVIAQVAQGGLFVLTILLATMLLSQLIEEKSNKIIEVLAAAVPVSAIFLGKLLAMLAVSLLGIAVWTAAGAAAFAMFAEQGLALLPEPAVGWHLFLLLSLIYFTMSYLLLGSIFLTVGGHASTAREVQVLSMPVTMAQIAVFAVAALAVGAPDSGIAIGAALFPLSSP